MKILVKRKDLTQFYKNKELMNKRLKEHKAWFPFRSSTNLAGIIADLMGDGHLQGTTKWRIDYTSKSKKELNRFGEEIWELWGIKGKIRICKTNKYNTMNYGVNCKPLAIILNLCGAPSGAKVLKNFNIPTWITENKEYFRRFISRLFSCEATVDKKGFIEIQMNKSTALLKNNFHFFFQIKNNLEKYFRIISTKPFTDNAISIRKDKIITKPIRLKIKQKESVKKFAELVSFEDSAKQKKLLKALEN